MTGTDLIVEVAGKLQDGEATGMLIVWTNEHGELQLQSNCCHTHALGLAEYARIRLATILVESADPK